MARDIDLTTKLSDADRDYLLARGREALVFENDAAFTGDPEAVAFVRYIPGTSVDRAPGVLDTPNGDPLVVNGGGDVAPGEGEDEDEPEPGDEESDDEPDAETPDDGAAEDYEGAEWTKATLRAEIERRNTERDEDDHLPVSGSKAEMAAVLVADDQSE